MIASYEASQRLLNSGITVKTEKVWVDGSLINGEAEATCFVPAPGMKELWGLIPKGTTIECLRNGYHIKYKMGQDECNILCSNPSDGICDLLIWLKVKENEPKEKADKLIKRLIDSYCDVNSDHDSTIETKAYLNVREEVKNLLIKALEAK